MKGLSFLKSLPKLILSGLTSLLLLTVWGNAAFAANGDISAINLTDGDGDGYIDQALISVENTSIGTWHVDNGVNSGIEIHMGGNPVALSAVTISDGTANPMIITVDIDTSDPNFLETTDGVSTDAVEVLYNPAGNHICTNCITDGTDNELSVINPTDLGVGDTEIDSTAAIIEDIEIYDTNSDGYVDRMDFVFSENIDTDDGSAPIFTDLGTITLPDGQTASGATALTDPACGSDTISVTGLTGHNYKRTSISSTSVAGITNEFNDCASIPNPTIAPLTNTAYVDYAEPVITTIRIDDDTHDGLIERVNYAFSEPVKTNPATNDPVNMVAADYGTITFPDGNNPTSSSPSSSACSISLNINVSGQVEKITDLGLFNVTGITNEWMDCSTVENISSTPLANTTFVDNADPIIIDAGYTDNNQDGFIDAINVYFSEVLDESNSDVVENSFFSLDNVGDFTGMTIFNNSDDALTADADVITILVDNPPANMDTHDDSGSFAFSISTGFIVRDLGGSASMLSTGALSTFDDAAPVISTLTYKEDVDVDGNIDSATITFTEDLVAASTLSLNNLNVTNAGDFTGLNFGTNASDLITALTSSIDLTMGSEASAVATHDHNNLFAFETTGAFSLEDSAGNTYTSAAAQSHVSIIDGAAPVATPSSILVSGATGTAGAFKIGDTVKTEFDSTDVEARDINTITADFSEFGDTAVGGVAMVDDGSGCDTLGGDDIWSACYTVLEQGVSATPQIDINTADPSVSGLSDTYGNVNASSYSDTEDQTIDNTYPVVTSTEISLIDGSCTGNSACIVGDPIQFRWDNTASGDNNGDVSSVEFDLSNFGAAADQAASNSSELWSYNLASMSADDDDGSFPLPVTVVDDAGNETSTSSSTFVSVDNILPVIDTAVYTITKNAVGDAAIAAISDSLNLNISVDVDDSDTITWDASPIGGLATQGNNTGVTISAGAIENSTYAFDYTINDDAGNEITGTTASTVAIDNVAPTVSGINLTIAETDCSRGTPGTCIVGDTVTVSWNNGATGDNNSDIDSMDDVRFDLTDLAGVVGADDIAATNNTAEAYTYPLTLISGTTDSATARFTATVRDNAGNVTGPITSNDLTNIDNEEPVITTAGSFTFDTDNNTNGVAEINDEIDFVIGTDSTGDTISSWTVDLTDLTGNALATSLANPHTVILGALNNATQTFTETITDDAGNTVNGTTQALSVDNRNALDAASISLSSYETSSSSSVKFAFTARQDWPADGNLVVTFPAQIDPSPLNGQSATSLVGVDGVITVSDVTGQDLTLTRDNSGSVVSGYTDVEFWVAGLTNPSTAGTSDVFIFETQDAASSTLDTDNSVSGVTFSTTPVSSSGGGGGGSSYSVLGGSSSTSTVSVGDSLTAKRTYTRSVDFSKSIFEEGDKEGEIKAKLTEENGELNLKSSGDSPAILTIDGDTYVYADEDWDGVINPPQYQIYSKAMPERYLNLPSGEVFERTDVVTIVELTASNSDLRFSQDITISIPTDLEDGTEVVIVYSEDGDGWEKTQTVVVENGMIVIKTNHFSYYAVFESDDVLEEADMIELPFTDVEGHWAYSYIEELYYDYVVNGKTDTSFEPNSYITRAELTKIALIAFGVDIEASDEASGFVDVDIDSWYAPYVKTAMENAIVNGYGDEFKPNAYIKRAEALKVLLLAAGVDEFNTAELSFSDVNSDSWYFEYVAHAVNQGIVNGYEDGTFRPGSYITRAEVSKLASLLR